MKYRRAPALVCYWHERRLIVENYLTRRRVAASPLVVSLLEAFEDWQDAARVRRLVPGLSAGQERRLLRALERASLLERSPQPRAPVRGWGSWLPHAGLLHFGTKDEPYPTPARAAAAIEKLAATVPPPPPTKSYRGSGSRALPTAAVLPADLDFVLRERRTWRRFGRSPLSLRDLATLLQLTWGVQQWGIAERGVPVALKTSPSGGATHPGEVYVAAFNVSRLPRGLYHYDAARHRLHRIGPSGLRPRLARYLPQQPWYRGAAALMLMTAVVGRERWKYQSPRAYRAMLIDAGHLCQTFCLVATALGLAPFCSMALADSRVETDLGLDGASEIVLYAAGVGARPARPVTTGS